MGGCHIWGGKMTDSDKVSKREANYRSGHGTQRCENCTMYRETKGHDMGLCTAVRGPIDRRDLCDYFERKK